MRANFTLDDHQQVVSAARRRGAHTITVNMPCCARRLEFSAPGDDSTWSDIRMCPVCSTVWTTVTTRDEMTFKNDGLGRFTRTGEE